MHFFAHHPAGLSYPDIFVFSLELCTGLEISNCLTFSNTDQSIDGLRGKAVVSSTGARIYTRKVAFQISECKS